MAYIKLPMQDEGTEEEVIPTRSCVAQMITQPVETDSPHHLRHRCRHKLQKNPKRVKQPKDLPQSRRVCGATGAFSTQQSHRSQMIFCALDLTGVLSTKQSGEKKLLSSL